MRKYFLLLGIVALTIAGLMLIQVINRYNAFGADKYFVFYVCAVLGAMIAGINFIMADKKLKKAKN
ncbi:hypothetical protein [Chitinophaga vietnamensis]|uniref:hypothetical protein n=1 Tax=Chitinophaga vietnamensis TaxID=2593957 RepID=UPI00117892D3|nr:hypothetical protein [Chitinophaga vietnamensis]